MGNGCVGSVQIYGQTYYFSDKDKYDAVIALQGDAAAQKTLVDNYQRQYGVSAVSTNEDDLTELVDGSSGNGAGTTSMSSQVDAVDYNNWLVNNGLSGISKLSAESKIEDVKAYYEQIANKLSSIMGSIDSALASKDPDTIDACMTELTYNMAALEGVSQQSGMGSIMSSDIAMAGMWGSAAVAGAATMLGATGTLATVAGVSVTIPGVGWAIAGVCAVAAIGIGIYNSVKQGEIDDLKEQMQQTMDGCTTKYQYAQKEIGETVEDTVSSIEGELKRLEDADFSDINDMNDMFVNINGILVFQASIEKWAGLCEKYGVPFEGQELLDKLGNEDNKTKYANEYVEKFVEHTKNAVEASGNVVDDTGTYIASADEINALISMLYDNEMTRNVDVTKLKELIEFIGETNQSDVNNDAGAIGDGMYTGGDGGGYDFSGYSGAVDAAGANQTGVDGAASNGQYDVDTTQYTDVQNEAKENAQKDVDEYLDNIDYKGKSVEELEELYNTTSTDLEDFSQYKDNLELDLSKLDTILAEIRAEQQARVDEYIDSISVSGKSMSELEELYDEVSEQGDAFKQASSEVDTSAFADVLTSIREEQQTIVDNHAEDVSSRVQSAASVGELATISAETAQFIETASEYEVNTGKLSAINALIKDKIQTIADEKAASYEMQASMVQTSMDADTLKDVINIEIAQFQNSEVNTASLQKVVSDLVIKANELRIEEAKKKAEEDAMNVPAALPSDTENLDDTANADNSNDPDGANEPAVIPAYEGDGVPAYNPDAENGDGEIPPAANGDGEPAGNPDGENGEQVVPPAGDGEVPSDGTGEIPPEGVGETPSTGENPPEGSEPVNNPENSDNQTEVPPKNPDGEENTTPPEGEENSPIENIPAEGETSTPPSTTDEPEGNGDVWSDNTITSVGQADETTPPVNTDDVQDVVEEGLEDGKTPEEIADEIEIEVQE